MFSWSLRVYLLLLNIIEKCFFFKCSRYKKIKRQNFSTNWQFTVTSLYLLFFKIIEKRFCFKFLDTKNQRGSIFQRTDIVPSLYLLFFKYYREALFFKCSRYKKLKRQNFSTNWQFTVVSLYLLFLNIIEKCFFFNVLDTKK